MAAPMKTINGCGALERSGACFQAVECTNCTEPDGHQDYSAQSVPFQKAACSQTSPTSSRERIPYQPGTAGGTWKSQRSTVIRCCGSDLRRPPVTGQLLHIVVDGSSSSRAGARAWVW